MSTEHETGGAGRPTLRLADKAPRENEQSEHTDKANTAIRVGDEITSFIDSALIATDAGSQGAVPAQVHVYAAEQLPWFEIHDDLPRYAGGSRAAELLQISRRSLVEKLQRYAIRPPS